MKPVLFPPTTTAPSSFGLGALSDCTSAVVDEERNGSFDLTFTVPITGRHFDEIEDRSLVLAKPNPYDAPQLFRVYRQTKPINGLVTFYAHHVSYDLDGIPVSPFSATTAVQAMRLMKQNSLVDNPFTFFTDLQTNGSMGPKVPTVIRALLGGVEGSLLDTFGGEFAFDNFEVKLLQARGENRGVKIRYGKNLVDMTQERNIEAVYTAVLPYWSDDEQLVQGSIRQAPGTADFVRVLPLDLSQQFDGKPTAAQLNEAGDAYIARNKISTPAVSLSVQIVPPGSLGIGSLEEVHPWDTLQVQFERLGVDAEAQVIAYSFDVLTEKYLKLELGDRRSSIADTIASIAQDIGRAPTSTAMQRAIKNATDLITGVSGGAVAWGFDPDTGLPIELYFMDTNDKTTARNVLRINRNGIGFSTNGINGPFETAWTIDGSFYAKFIAAGTIVADKIGNGAVTEPKIGGEAVTTAKLGPLAVTNPKIGGGAVSYGKTSFTGTLDQVGINKSNIEAINALFVGRLGVANLIVNGEFYFGNRRVYLANGYLRYQ